MTFKTIEEILIATENQTPSEIAYSDLTVGGNPIHNLFSNLFLTRSLRRSVDSFLSGKLTQKEIDTHFLTLGINFSQVVFYLEEPILTVEELYSDSSYEDCIAYELQIVDQSKLRKLYEDIYKHLFEVESMLTNTKISQYR